jgi:glycosyltransferase involved in cell wall biosynthesis
MRVAVVREGLGGYDGGSAVTIRLLMVSQPSSAGVPRHVLDLVSHLDRRRFHVDVACPAGSQLWRDTEGMAGVVRHAFDSPRGPGLADVASLARLLPLVRRADVVHAHSSKAGFLVRLAAALSGRTGCCVFTPHGWSFWAFRGVQSGIYQQLERLAARWCGAIVAVSDFERACGLEAGVGRPHQYRVIPNGLMPARFQVLPRPVPGRVLLVGRLARQKCPELALLVMQRLRDEVPGAHLDVVGDGPLRARIEQMVASLQLQGSVHLLGHRDDVPALLSRAACLLLTSEYEGCSLSVLEGMAGGVPVVAPDIGGIAELIEHGRTGYIAERSVASLAAAVRAVLVDPSGARRMGDAAREEARQRFSLDRMVADTVTVYETIAAARRISVKDVPLRRSALH